jgi:hypothetical protein
VVLLCYLGGAVPAVAQVGHDPAISPFRDVTTRQAFTAFGGWFSGNGAVAGVGAQPGVIAGLRFQTRLSGPLDLWATFAGINSTRYVVNPDSPLTSRTTGPVNYGLVAADMALGFNLTGLKTWHGLAPFVSLGAGVTVPTDGTTDPGGYEARQNFTFVPGIGTRLVVSRSLSLHAELRDYLIRYEWPLAYFEPTNTAVPPVLDRDERGANDWTSNLALSFGLSWRFSF